MKEFIGMAAFRGHIFPKKYKATKFKLSVTRTKVSIVASFINSQFLKLQIPGITKTSIIGGLVISSFLKFQMPRVYLSNCG